MKSPLEEERALSKDWNCLAGSGGGVHSLPHLAAAQAGGAHADALAGPIHDCTDGPQVYVPTPLGHVVGVADVISKLRFLAAHIAYLCHETLQTVDSIAASEDHFRKAELSKMMSTEGAILWKISSLGNRTAYSPQRH